MEVVIPYEPRPLFLPLHERTQRWGVVVAHRRAGKTVACINDLIRAAITCPREEPRFAYIAPYYAQAKDVAWSYLKKFTAPIPGAVPHESELRVDLPNGGRVRLYGADNYDRLRGLYLDGVILDEYGDMDPSAWAEVIRPALSDRAGWAIFIGTPKGRNHFAEMWEEARAHPEAWLSLMLKASETNVLPPEELADARQSMTEDQYAQEYECSFQAAVMGAYYGREMQQAEDSGRLLDRIPWEPKVKVHTAWDLGISDSTSIWFAQCVGREVRIIDYLEHSGVGLDWYAKELGNRPYVYGDYLLPHDGDVKELGTGRSRVETLRSLGLQNITILPAQRVADGINAARLLLPRCYFAMDKAKRGVEALRNYRREWDERRKVYHDRPLHDWSSHAADAFRYLALGLKDTPNDAFMQPIKWPTPVKSVSTTRTYI